MSGVRSTGRDCVLMHWKSSSPRLLFKSPSLLLESALLLPCYRRQCFAWKSAIDSDVGRGRYARYCYGRGGKGGGQNNVEEEHRYNKTTNLPSACHSFYSSSSPTWPRSIPPSSPSSTPLPLTLERNRNKVRIRMKSKRFNMMFGMQKSSPRRTAPVVVAPPFSSGVLYFFGCCKGCCVDNDNKMIDGKI